ncbi:hypothetical protein BGZ46_008836 [Entomortierella lignicola]|nr:hypothetical protein BGZ46_008836 [Entomortierella lignicola]
MQYDQPSHHSFLTTSNVEFGQLTDHISEEHGLTILQAREQLPQVQGPDLHRQPHRPDSPSSLEDSQSESGTDSFSADTSDTEQSLSRFPNGSGVATHSKEPMSEQHNMKIHTDFTNSNALMSPSQVATPPLSPIKISIEETEENRKSDIPESTLRSLNESEGPDVMNEAAEDSILPDTVTGTEPQQNTSTPIPKSSAWSTLLPGVAPIPASKPQQKPIPRNRASSTTHRSDDIRLHERFPIVLPPESEAKLSMEMVDLFESLLPTEESHERRTKLIKKIENILQLEWPGQDIQAHPFGSTVNDLGTSSSDVDICIMTTWSGLKNVQMLANAFRKHGMQKVFCVPRAKVPIVKLWDPEL